MTDDVAGILERQPTLQTVTWLLSLRKFGQLDLDPPYQRKSVWTLKEKQRFLDTILRNYPSPALFLHLSLDDQGNPTYHVVDGKQRISTILDFVDNKLRLAADFGDSRLDGQKWRALDEYPGVKSAFWKYQVTVELIDDVHEPLVREVFSRLNQNSRKLERQEIRHARFDGWLISFVESFEEVQLWRQFKVVTRARSKRMADAQLLLELVQVILEGRTVGFDQDALDELCATYDDVDVLEGFDEDAFRDTFERASALLAQIGDEPELLAAIAGSRNNIYSVWSYLVLEADGPLDLDRLLAFFKSLERLRETEKSDPTADRSLESPDIVAYLVNSAGAATEGPQRAARHRALTDYLGGGKGDDTSLMG